MKSPISIENNAHGLLAADVADRLERLPLDEARQMLLQLSPAQGAATLSELDAKDAAGLLGTFTRDQILSRLQLLSPNQVADLVLALPPERREEVLKALPPDISANVTALLHHPADSAGGIMDNRFIAVTADLSVEACLAKLRASSRQRTDELLYVYVTDDFQKLVGVVSLRELVFAASDRRVGEIMNRDVWCLGLTDDQEEVSRRIQHHGLLGLPVVDEQQRLVGVVKLRDAIRVAENEATEDMQLMVGLSGEERLWTPWKNSIARRLPWLGVNLITALGASAVVGVFENTLARWTALVVFLPLISAVAGNTGNQALTVIIRALALGEVTPGDALRVMRKELVIGLANGCLLGLAIGLLAFGWKGSVLLGAVVGAAMLLNQIVGALSGVAVPFGLRRLGVDPALASSIFVTTITDIIGFFLFLGLATIAIWKSAL